MTSNQTKFFIDSDNPRPKFPFDDEPIDSDDDYSCRICSKKGSKHSASELLRCALNELRGVKVVS